MGPAARGGPLTGYSGWALHGSALLATLLQAGVPPVHPVVDCEHITHRYPDDTTAPPVDQITIVGVAADERIQALVVEVDGSTVRPDGRVYHVTYSLAPGVPPVESNRLLAEVPVRQIGPIPVRAYPFWRPLGR